jgi:hypothetical protein
VIELDREAKRREVLARGYDHLSGRTVAKGERGAEG